MFLPSSLSYIVITATFGRVGLLGLTGVGSGNEGSEVSVDMVLSVEELSALSLKNKTFMSHFQLLDRLNYHTLNAIHRIVYNYL